MEKKSKPSPFIIQDLLKIWPWTILKTKRRNNISNSRYTFKYGNELKIVTSDMIMVLLVLEKVIFLAALLLSSPHLFALLVPVPQVPRRDPIVFIIQLFPLVMKVANYDLIKMFCMFRVKFCWLCSTNLRVLLLKFLVPGLSNSFPEISSAWAWSSAAYHGSPIEAVEQAYFHLLY